jgi:hypothetical protein
MRVLNTGPITTSVAMPLKSGSLDHIQAAYSEAIAETVKGLVGAGYNSGVAYILNGCQNFGAYPNFNISSGSVFFNGEVYLVDAANFNVSGSQVPVLKVVVTQFAGVQADSVLFNDGAPRNVHDIRKVQITADLAGSGISNYASAQRINSNIPQLNLTGNNGVSVTGSYPNLNVSGTNNNPVILATNIFLGDLNNGSQLDQYTTLLSGGGSGQAGYRYIYPVAVGHTNYVPILVLQHDLITSNADAAGNYMCLVQCGQRSATDLYFFVMTTATGSVQNLELKLLLINANILYA